MQHIEHTRFLGPNRWIAIAVLAALLAGGALALSPTQGRRALLDQLQRAATQPRGAAAPARAGFVRRSSTGYVIAVTLTPNRATGPIGLSLRVLRHGRSLHGARVRVGFSMASMNMWNAYTAALSALPDGRYAANIPVLGMAGSWRLRIVVTPRSGRPFHVTVNDRIAA
ncbi:MAG TPA: hypothetical protein VFI54_23365 [Solirubrobacteraceae bacterium]|nr:hypothetical protein [Solirubrobacteraceae bacterium]